MARSRQSTSMYMPSHPLLSLLTAILASLAFTSPAAAATKPKNAILLSEVQSLTLRSGAKTTHRRVSASPQLKCISHANICKLHEVDLMRCTNQGSGYSSEDIQWSCTTSLPSTLKLGSTDVICEGYANADDEYVLKGSCGVEYRLILSEEGEKQYPHLASGGGGRAWGSKSSPHTGGSDEGKLDWSGIIFIFIFVGILAWMLYSACTAPGPNSTRNTTRRPRNGGGGGGGWGPGGGGGGFGGWGNDDPPPPYPGSKPSSSSSSRESWRPGFFSGAATGAAAGYFAGQRGNRQQQRRDYGGGNAGSSWFGGGGGGGGGSPSYSSTNNDHSSSSSSRYESTGFGSTSRR